MESGGSGGGSLRNVSWKGGLEAFWGPICFIVWKGQTNGNGKEDETEMVYKILKEATVRRAVI